MNNTLKQTFQGKSMKKYRNIGRKHTNAMENFDVFNTPKNESIQAIIIQKYLDDKVLFYQNR